jgi:hypothetical protein
MHDDSIKFGPGRMLLLTTLGGLGVAGDHVNRIIHLDRLLKILVRRGERVEQRAVTLIQRTRSRVRRPLGPRAVSHKS